MDLADPRLQRILLEEAACDVRLLEGGLPTRALVATLSPTSHLLLITWHHVSIDGMVRNRGHGWLPRSTARGLWQQRPACAQLRHSCNAPQAPLSTEAPPI